jgi:tetratricopeptide (TPR) repeat protein
LDEAAGKPGRAALAQEVSIGTTQLYAWLGGTSLPSGERVLLKLVEELQNKAAGKKNRHTRHPPSHWKQLLSDARKEHPPGGRPRTTARAIRASGPVNLPLPPAFGLSGRDDSLRELRDWLDPARYTSSGGQGDAALVVSAVAGMGGVGKTALALRAAHEAKEHGWFPGGVLFADVRGYSPDGEVETGALAGRLLTLLTGRPRDVPATAEERLDAWRALLHEPAGQRRPLLLVLDNVRTAGRVAALLPPPPHKALITSRRSLSGLSARTIRLNPLTVADAMDLLERALTAGGAPDDRVATQPDGARRLAELCGCLPLALMIIACLLCDERERPLADQAEELADVRTRLDVLEYDDVDAQGRPLAVRAAFELSYRHLRGDQARVFRLLAAAPGPDLSTAAATALIGQPGTRRLLSALASAHLVRRSTGGRWSMHDLVRLFADDHGRARAAEDGREAAVNRLLDHYVTTAVAAVAHVEPGSATDGSGRFTDRDAALVWLDAEHPNLVAAALSPEARSHGAGVALGIDLTPYLGCRRHFDDAIALSRTAAGICHDRGDRRAEGKALNNLGLMLWETRRFKEAIDAHRVDLAICEETGDRRGKAMALNNLGLALHGAKRFQGAVNVLLRAIDVYGLTGDRHREAQALNNLGLALHGLGQDAGAARAHATAADVFQRMGDRRLEASALANLGAALRGLGRYEDAVAAHGRDLELCRGSGHRHGEGQALLGLGLTLQAAGDFEKAVRAYGDAAAIFQETGDQRREAEARGNLAQVLASSGRREEGAAAFTEAAALFRESEDPDDERRALSQRERLATGRPDQ